MSVIFNKNNYINNIIKIKRMTNSKLCLVIKSNGYGIGIENIMKMNISEYIDYFAITENYEAELIRKYDKKCKIIRIRSAVEHEIKDGIQYDIEEIVDSIYKLRLILQKFKHVKVHLSIDQKMNNMGIKIDDIIIDSKNYNDILKLNLIGIMGHFPSIVDLNDIELIKFINLSNKLKKNNFKKLIIHLCNSDNFLKHKEKLSFDMIRIGYSILGGTHSFLNFIFNWKINPVSIRKLNRNQPLGYNSNFIANKNMTIAILPIGYNNGFPKLKNNDQYVTFKGKRYKIVGDVNMNQIHIDITDSDITLNDEIEILENNFRLKNLKSDKYYNDSYLIINILRNNKVSFV